MNTVVNLVLGLAGAGAVSAGLSSIKEGAAGVNAELGKGSIDALGLGKFVTLAGAAAGALYGLKAALNLGGELNDLSARTGQSVRDLVILRQAFQAAGLGAESVGPTLNKVQKALGGVNEMGESTIAAFKRLGISIEALRSKSGLEQFQELTKGFAKIEDPAQRAAVSMQLFGREGGQLLQLFSDSSALETAADDAGTLAEQMQANAKAFDEVGDRLDVFKVKFTSMAVSALERMMPVLNTAAAAIKGLDLTGMGAVFGAAVSILAPAGALAKMVSFLDNKVVDWTSKLGPGLVQNIGSSLSSLTGLLSKLLPAGLALAVGAAIIAGIEAALIEADRREIEAENRRASKKHAEVVDLQSSRSMEEVAAKRAALQKELDDLNAKEKTQILKPASVTQVYNPALQGFSTVASPETRGLNEEQLKRRKDLQDLIKGSASEGLKTTVAKNQESDAAAARLKAAQETVKVLKEQADTYAKNAADLKYSLANDQTKLDLLDKQQSKAQSQLETDQAAARLVGDQVALAAAQSKFDAASLRIQQDKLAVEKSIEEVKKKAADAEEKRLKLAQEARKAELDASRLKLENDKMEIDRKLSELDSNYARADFEKWSDRRKLLLDSVAAAKAYLEKIQAIRDAATSPEEKAILDQGVRAARQDLTGANSAVGAMGPDPTSYADQIVASTTAAMNQIGSLQQQTARLWSATSDNIRTTMGGSLGDIALQGGSTRDKLAAAAASIYTSFVRNGAQMVVDWNWQHLVMANVRRAFEGLTTAEAATGAGARGMIAAGETIDYMGNVVARVGAHTAGEGAKTGASIFGTMGRKALMLGETIWHGIQVGIRTVAHVAGEGLKTAVSLAQWAIRLPVLLLETGYHLVLAGIKAMTAMASIPYVGPILAIAALAAVVAAGSSLMKKGFATGGDTGGSNPGRVAGVVHEQEWVAPAWMRKNPKYAGLIDWLESERAGSSRGSGSASEGYGLGGFAKWALNPAGMLNNKLHMAKLMQKAGVPRWAAEASEFDEKNPFWSKQGARWLRDNGYMASNKPLERYSMQDGEWVSSIDGSGQTLSSAGVISNTYASAGITPSTSSSGASSSAQGIAAQVGSSSAQPLSVGVILPDMEAQMIQTMQGRAGTKIIINTAKGYASYIS